LKIKSIEAVRLGWPKPEPTVEARYAGKTRAYPRAYPIHKYPEFNRTLGNFPGGVAQEIGVVVTAEDGTWGFGSCHWGSLVLGLIEHHFTPLLVGRDCFAIEFLNDLMWRSTQRFGAAGLSTVARSAIDLALWDLKGKLLGVPVYSLLGGPSRKSMTCYAASDDVEWAMELGFNAVKISNPAHYEDGIGGINAVEDKVGRARELLGDNRELMLNPVMSYNVEFAIRLFERLKPYGLRWIEEPLIADDFDGLSLIKQAIPTQPLATGESHRGRHAFNELIKRRCVDIVQPDLRWCGGLTEAVKIYNLAEAAGLEVVPHTGAATASGLHFACSLPEAGLVEYFIQTDPGIPLNEAALCVPGLPVPVNGTISPNDAPGWGLEVRREDLPAWH
jgi:L-rhamnonate dehydratase